MRRHAATSDLQRGEVIDENKQQGFTLVEIAIVLVIIGLLLGGILKGQEMITQAKIKNVIADFSGVSAAYHGYQDRYRAIPGDDPNAATRWAVAPAATAGNGNGVVAGTYNGAHRDRRVAPSGGITCAAPASCPAPARSSRSTRVTGKIGVQTGDGAAPRPTHARHGGGGFSA